MNNQLLLKGILRPFVLSLLLNHESVYGYFVIKKMNEISAGKIKITEGALYPLLAKIEKDGFIKSELKFNGSRKTKLYKLTTEGKINAQIEVNLCKEYIKLLLQII